MLHNEGDSLTKVVVCKPEKAFFEIDHMLLHNITEVADPALAQQQHAHLAAVMRAFGAEVIYIDELAAHPNSIFTKDSVTVSPEGYIKLRMGLPTRAAEPAWMAAFLDRMNVPCAGEIVAPGTVEGGDVIIAGKTAFVGLSSRTNLEGARQMAKIFRKMGIQTRLADIPSMYLHIGGAMTLVSPDEVLCCEGVFPESYFEGFQVITVAGDDLISGNIIALGNREIISDTKNVSTNTALHSAGYKLHTLDLSEFVKGNGGPSCLMMSLERK